jgi:archaellum component FlaG (FlaF/FlaG flagellin family)
MGYLGGMGGTTTMGTMSLDTATANATSNTIAAYIRNIGQSSIDFDKAYVGGVQIQDVNFTANPDPLQVEQVSTITIGVNMNSGTTYSIKVIGTDNTQLTFSVKAK